MNLEGKAKIVADYLTDKRNTQAVLINGAWGAGAQIVINIYIEKL